MVDFAANRGGNWSRHRNIEISESRGRAGEVGVGHKYDFVPNHIYPSNKQILYCSKQDSTADCLQFTQCLHGKGGGA